MRIFQPKKQLTLLAYCDNMMLQSRSTLSGLSCVVPVSSTSALLLWTARTHSMRASAGSVLTQSQEIPGQKSPATRRCSIAAGVAVRRQGQRVYFGPLHLQPAAIHQAAGVPRIGIPAPAQRSQTGCLADARARRSLHEQQGVSSPAMACANGSREANAALWRCCQLYANSIITVDMTLAPI